MIDDLTAGKAVSTVRGDGHAKAALWVFLAIVAAGLFAAIGQPDLLKKAEERLLGRKNRASGSSYLGLAVQDISDSMSRALGLGDTDGVMVTEVLNASPAARTGIRRGDVVLRFDGTPVADAAELEELIAKTDPGDTVGVVIDRRGQVRTYYVEIDYRPSYLMQAALVSQDENDDEWGCTLAPVDSKLAGRFSLPATAVGVAVVAVDSKGIAAVAGLKPGDVIVSVNRTATLDLASFYREIENKQNLVLEIVRNGETSFVQVKASKSAAPPIATIAGSLTDETSLPRRIAVAADGTDLNAAVSYRFGTAPFFIITDLAAGRYTAIRNDLNTDQRGFGLQAAQRVAAEGVGATIARTYGPQAYDALKSFDIKPFTTEATKIADAINLYRSGQSAVAAAPSLPGYAYTRSIITTGGGSESDDEEQSGYKGMPYSIPPKGKYDSALDPRSTAVATARTTGGGSEDDDEEQSGYKGMPYSIPPKGKYDPALDPNNPLQTTAGSSQRADYCYCPICQKLIPHPPSVSCAELTCPECGTRLRNFESGSTAPTTGVTPPMGILPLASSQTTRTLVGSTVPATGASQLPAPGQVPAMASGPMTGAQAMRSPMMSAAPGASVGMMPMQGQTQSASLLPSLGIPMMRAPVTETAPSTGYNLLPMQQNQTQSRTGGAFTSAIVPGTGLMTTQPLYLNQQAQYCVCPICGKVYEKPLGVPCAALSCSSCGSRLVSTSPGSGFYSGGQPAAVPGQSAAGLAVAGTPSSRTTGGNGMTTAGPTTIPPGGPQQSSSGRSTTGQTIVGQPPAQQTSVGMTSTVGPGVTPPGGTRSNGSSVLYSARSAVGNQPPAIGPMGQTTAGMLAGGKPDTIPPMGGQTAAGMAVAGTPTAGMAVAGMPTAGMAVAGMPTAGMAVAGMPAAGMAVAGMPAAGMAVAGTPTAGMATAGMLTGGKPDTIPPMGGQTAAGMTAGGTPTAGMAVAGPSTIPPTGVRPSGSASAGSAVASATAGQPALTAPMGRTAAGSSIVGAGTIAPAGQTTAGFAASDGSVGVLQGIVDGNCVCPKCGATVPHERGTACYTIPCPSCGTAMVREGALSNLPGTVRSQAPAGSAPLAAPGATAVSGDPASAALTIAAENSGKICIAALGTSMNDDIAPMFDRAPYFLIVELGHSKVVANPNVQDRMGVGVQSAQLVVSEGAMAVITNDISVKALEELNRLRIQVFTGVNGTTKQALSWYQNGRLTPSTLNEEKKEEHSGSSGKGRESKTVSSTSSSSSSSSSKKL